MIYHKERFAGVQSTVIDRDVRRVFGGGIDSSTAAGEL